MGHLDAVVDDDAVVDIRGQRAGESSRIVRGGLTQPGATAVGKIRVRLWTAVALRLLRRKE